MRTVYLFWITVIHGMVGRPPTIQLLYPYMLGSMWRVWNEPHYRTTSFGCDMHDNLVNVFLPHTPVCLAWFTTNKYLYVFSILVLYPNACMAYSMLSKEHTYEDLLLHGHHSTWFGSWRMNCFMLHVSGAKPDHHMYENKGCFIRQAINVHGMSATVAADSYLKHQYIVCKDTGVGRRHGCVTTRQRVVRWTTPLTKETGQRH